MDPFTLTALAGIALAYINSRNGGNGGSNNQTMMYS